VDVTWQDGKLVSARVKAVPKGKKSVTIRYDDRTAELEIKSGGEVWLNAELQRPEKSR